jgi:SAM-dependent methyltransferase
VNRRNGFLVATGLAAAAFGQVAHQHHPPDTAEYARVLEDPQRDSWQKPHEVVMALALKPTETVADIGAGSGYFTRRFAMHAGRVYAVDIDSKLLEIALKDAPRNVEAVLATPDDPKLPAASVDTIFFRDGLHHIDHRGAYYAKLEGGWLTKCKSFDFLPYQYFTGLEVTRQRRRQPRRLRSYALQVDSSLDRPVAYFHRSSGTITVLEVPS